MMVWFMWIFSTDQANDRYAVPSKQCLYTIDELNANLEDILRDVEEKGACQPGQQ